MTVDAGCDADPNTVADLGQLTAGAAAIRCAPWDVGTGVAGYVWHAPNARAALLLEHGWGDYAQRYVTQGSRLIPHLLARGITVYAVDMWGHGRSPGPRGATDIEGAVEDHLAARRKLREQPLPVFVLGHSVGGLVTAASVLRDPTDLHGMILVAPTLKWQVDGILLAVARTAAFLVPTMSVPVPPPDPITQSRDPHLHERLQQDPLMVTKSVSWLTIGSGAAIANASWQSYPRISVPVLLVNGTADPVTPPAASREFLDAVQAGDETLALVEGGLHALLDDPPANREALQIILSWLDRRFSR